MSLWGADFHIVFKLRFLFLLFDDLHRFFVRCILTCRKETILINFLKHFKWTGLMHDVAADESCLWHLQVSSSEKPSWRCDWSFAWRFHAPDTIDHDQQMLLPIPKDPCMEYLHLHWDYVGKYSIHGSYGDDLHVSMHSSKWLKPRTASSQRPSEFAVLDAWCWELSMNELQCRLSAEQWTQCGQNMWAVVNTHYLVDGHPIHNKDPYNG